MVKPGDLLAGKMVFEQAWAGGRTVLNLQPESHKSERIGGRYEWSSPVISVLDLDAKLGGQRGALGRLLNVALHVCSLGVGYHPNYSLFEDGHREREVDGPTFAELSSL